jgi:epoxide hydrolase-like predicted phosphatase
MSQTKAIIFDCFGVLVESSLEPFCDKYLGNDNVKIAKVKKLDREANSGQMSYKEFVVEMAKLADISVKETRRFLDYNPANTRLMNFIRDELQPNYKIGFLSNASANWLDELFTPEQQSLFDDIILSFEHGLTKPDAAIFHLAAQRLGVKPSECVFVDDILSYCEGAESTGMQAVCYKSFAQLEVDLSHILDHQT